MKLCILHFDLIPFAIRMMVSVDHKIFGPCWQKTAQVVFDVQIWGEGFNIQTILQRPEQAEGAKSGEYDLPFKLLATYQTCMGSLIILVEHYTFSIDQFWFLSFECIT